MMNAKALTERLAADLDRELNVVPFRSHDPESKVDRLASIYRRELAQEEQRRADTRKGLKSTVATIAANRKALKARFEADMASLAEREAMAKEQAETDIEAHDRLIASSKAALDALAAE